MVGLAQWVVLRHAFQGINWHSWVLATIIGAFIAWFFGSIPMTMASLSQPSASTTVSEPPQTVVLLLAAGMGLVAGLILSIAQWRVLRKQVEKAWVWLPANALAWAAGMPIIFAAVNLTQLAGSIGGSVMVMAVGIALPGNWFAVSMNTWASMLLNRPPLGKTGRAPEIQTSDWLRICLRKSNQSSLDKQMKGETNA